MSKTVKPYEAEADNKKSQVSRMFNNIAPYYDLLNRLLSLGIDKSWRRKAIAQIAPLKPKYILDVATGTADVAIATAKEIAPDKIIGIDIANEMLEIGREKITKHDLENTIELQLGDSENIDFPDNTFDAITVAFGAVSYTHLTLPTIYAV